MNNADMPAMPHPLAMSSDGNMYGIGEHDPCSGGLTKLEHFAGLAMQAILSNSTAMYGISTATNGCGEASSDWVASMSITSARALLKQLEGESNE